MESQVYMLNVHVYCKFLTLKAMSFNSSEKKTILVQNYIAVHSNEACKMPFSWRIKDYLEEIWEHALQREGIFIYFSFISFLFFSEQSCLGHSGKFQWRTRRLGEGCCIM